MLVLQSITYIVGFFTPETKINPYVSNWAKLEIEVLVWTFKYLLFCKFYYPLNNDLLSKLLVRSLSLTIIKQSFILVLENKRAILYWVGIWIILCTEEGIFEGLEEFISFLSNSLPSKKLSFRITIGLLSAAKTD